LITRASGAGSSPTADPGERGDTAPGFSILGSLCADEPYPDWRDALMVFGQFVGTWDLAVEYYDDTGRRTYQGRWEWSFAAFTWTGLESADGQEWRLNQTTLATRRPGT